MGRCIQQGVGGLEADTRQAVIDPVGQVPTKRLGTAGWPQGLPPDVATPSTSFNRLGRSARMLRTVPGCHSKPGAGPMTAPHAGDTQDCHPPSLKLQAQDKP